MEEQNSERITVCPTKAGNGFKLCVNGVWFYASKGALERLVTGQEQRCTFRTIDEQRPLDAGTEQTA